MKQSTTRLLAHCVHLVLTGALLIPTAVLGCTIVSAVAEDGQVWNANNEDGPAGVANFINVFPQSENAKYGYYTLSYFSPEQGQGGSMQGGMNEAGLTFDFNAIDYVEAFDPTRKKAFPAGDHAILPHILANMHSVQEVIKFFETYWFQDGFRGAQMHLADRQGRFAIISASGVKLVEKGQPLVSTNFDICGQEDGSSCWRYPIATARVTELGASLATMKTICRETTQKNGATMYSNIQNLTTGEVWFSSKHDPNAAVRTSISDLLARGRKSYTFRDLTALVEARPERQWIPSAPIELSEAALDQYAGSYQNAYAGTIRVRRDGNGLQFSFEDGQSMVFYPVSSTVFYFPDEDVSFEFGVDQTTHQKTVSLREGGYWSLTAWENSASQ